MWRFLPGVTKVSSSSEKNTAPGNDSTQATMTIFSCSTSRTQRTARDFHDCEKTRTRKFSSKWQVGRSWLRNEEKGMICEWCTEHRQALQTQNVLTSTKFIDGCTSYKAELISIARLEKHPQAEVEVVEVYEDALLLLNQPRK